jgi:hypothetical protein
MVNRNLPECVSFPMQVPRLTRLSRAICMAVEHRSKRSQVPELHAA